MSRDLLRGELERLFSREEMATLAQCVLGQEADEDETVTDPATPASLARALVQRCDDHDALDALADTMVLLHADVDEGVRTVRFRGVDTELDLSPGTRWSRFTIETLLGRGPTAWTYRARDETSERAVVLRVLRRDLPFDARRVQAYLAYQRLLAASALGTSPDDSAVSGLQEANPWLCYAWVEGQTLAARSARRGALHLTEAWSIGQGLFEALAAWHGRRFVHGNIKLENTLLLRDQQRAARRVRLLDGGVDVLRRWVDPSNDHGLGAVWTPKIAAPELHRGQAADVRSDVYACGVLLYETLTGQAPFVAATPADLIALHLTKEPAPPSSVAPPDWIGEDLDQLVLAMLAKNPAERPRDARALLDQWANLHRGGSQHPPVRLPKTELTRLVQSLLAAPTHDDAVTILEVALAQGADATQIADGLAQALADSGAGTLVPDAARYWRVALLFEHPLSEHGRAERVLLQLVALEPTDPRALERLYGVWRRLGKHDATLSSLLDRLERTKLPPERGALFFQMGAIYAEHLDDRLQASNAYARALAEVPASSAYLTALEQTAASEVSLWSEVLAILAEAVTTSTDPAVRTLLLLHLGNFSLERGHRPDLALPFFQRVLEEDEGNEAALVGLAAVFQATHQWGDLAAVQLRRADRVGRPAEARALRFAAATLLEERGLDAIRAKELYEQILVEDPDHREAQEILQGIYERTGDERRLLPLLERRVASREGPAKARLLGRIAELYEGHRDDPESALLRYGEALAADPDNVDALRGQERLFSRLGRHHERQHNLERQLALATTPRQRIDLLLRIAALQDEEFLDQNAAAATYEKVLALDPDHETSLTALVRHYRVLGRWDDLAAIYERLIATSGDDSNHPDLWLARGRVLSEHVGDVERALASFKAALDLRPGHAGALEAIAKLRETNALRVDDNGEWNARGTTALPAGEHLPTPTVPWRPYVPSGTEIGSGEVTTKVMTPDTKAEKWSQAARLLEASGDHEGALEQYRLVLEAKPDDAAAAAALHRSPLSETAGDAQDAIDLLRKAIQHADNRLLKARLYGEMAKLLRDRQSPDAEGAARHAFELDAAAVDARVVLGDYAFQRAQLREAVRFYEPLVVRPETLPAADAARVIVRYAEALAQTGDVAEALQTLDGWASRHPDDAAAVRLAARLAFEHAPPEQARERVGHLLERFGDQLSDPERAVALYQRGESARRVGDLDDAITQLNAALDLAPDSPLALPSLGKIYEHQQDWEALVRIKKLHLATATGDLRGDLLADMAEIFAVHLGDRPRAMSLLTVALEERPNERRWLSNLMQLYGEEKEWAKLVMTLSRLAELLDDEKQKAQYLHRAATISRRQLQDANKALDYYHQALSLEPSLAAARTEAIEVASEIKQDDELEWLLRGALEDRSENEPNEVLLGTFDQLGDLYERQGRIADTIDALEAAQVIDPANTERNARLAALYLANAPAYFDKAVDAQRRIIEVAPEDPTGYRVLRKLYTDAKRADAAWCLCQALAILRAASADEASFYQRMRSDTPAITELPLSDEAWVELVNHPWADPLVTSVFALIEPALINVCSKPLSELGHDEAAALNLADHPFPVVQALVYAAPILALPLPPAFRNPSGGGLGFLHARHPALLLGPEAFDPEVDPQVAMFWAVRHLTYYRPGFYVRRLLPPGAGLEAWLLAAVKLVVPHFHVASSLGTTVERHVDELARSLLPPEREQLGRIVPKLLESGSATDLLRWMHAVDYTADRAGFLLAHDLQAVVNLVQSGNRGAGATTSSAPPAKERCDELLLYASSAEYFELRQRLAIGVDS